MLRYYTVFNSEQCEGIAQHVPAPFQRVVNHIEACETILKNYTSCPPIVHRGNQPYYSPQSDYVCMPEQTKFITTEAYYATLFHELTHSTGHAKRLNREGITSHKANFASCEYSKEELIAELGNCFLINHAGLLSDSLFENSASYIQSWISVLEDNPQMIIQASAKAQQAVDYILNVEAVTLDVAA
ncbi:MAG TPA: zincin-like metallopeptidase domain-containing protein [Bacteroidia bacterium]|nr:zincin-like metallopeptidase domain-containing protein [Bacteroidia bacterium]